MITILHGYKILKTSVRAKYNILKQSSDYK